MHPMLNIAVRAARKAGDFIAKSAENLKKVNTIQKGTNDFVTNIDTAAECIIVDVIKKSYPNHCIFTEEVGTILGSNLHYQWIIDPLDGTTNFIKGIPHFSISIALRIKDRTEVACVYDPIRDELFTSQRGYGAQLNNKRLRVSNAKNLYGTILATGFPYKAKQHSEGFMKVIGALFIDCADFRRTGSAALDLCYVAAARVDGFFELGLKPWDMAAGELIAREAGALCTDFSGGTNYMQSGNIVAAGTKVLKGILAHIHDNTTEAMRK
ncbi:inositol-1-monophosphatase [Candidatus Enterovibrio escicola]|uniref:inositol-1-monophosphatase n=1 Tax=Candidatus Enterovibrio escicola TaxID=1927127 RepID=UPI001237EABE|nr:inositol-1-monophosphatase [Candidatus Enterovibrio escacola]